MNSGQHKLLPPLNWQTHSIDELFDRIATAGIVGMGGAGFSTAEKIRVACSNSPCVVVANGVESDPGVSADQALLHQRTEEIIEGVHIVARITAATKVHLVVTQDHVKQLIEKDSPVEWQIHVLTPTFQNGEERELIRSSIGTNIPRTVYPATCGFLVLNVHTLFAITLAVRGVPLRQRIVTVFGQDQWIDLDTPLSKFQTNNQPIRHGCYETGFIPDENEVVSMTTNAISYDRSADSIACIHCGWCTEACPINLAVEVFHDDVDRTQISEVSRDTVNQCNECGECVTVCPSRIHLVDEIRSLKRQLHNEQTKRTEADGARQRHEARLCRIARSANEAKDLRTKRMQKTRAWN